MQMLPGPIDALSARVAELLATGDQVNEEETKSGLVSPMLRALGWDCEDRKQVRLGYRYKRQDNPVDYALMVGGQPVLFVEAKALGSDLVDRKWRRQAVNYANTAGVQWCVLTEGNMWQIYNSKAPGDLDEMLFLETRLHPPDGRSPSHDPAFILSLLSRKALTTKVIGFLWDHRACLRTLTDLVTEKSEALVQLIQKRTELPESDVRAFLDRVRVTVGAPRDSVPPPTGLLRIVAPRKGITATGRLTPQGILVLKGSQAALHPRASLPNVNSRRRDELIRQGVLEPSGSELVFTRDYLFTGRQPRPSVSAAIILGGEADGWELWKDDEGRNLNDVVGRNKPKRRPRKR